MFEIWFLMHKFSVSQQNIQIIMMYVIYFLGLSSEILMWHYKWTWYDFCDKCLIKRTLFERGKCIDYLLGLGLNCVDQMTEKFYQKLLNKYDKGVQNSFEQRTLFQENSVKNYSTEWNVDHLFFILIHVKCIRKTK